MSGVNSQAVLTGMIIILAVVALQTYLIQVIWNHVIIKKFPNANIQELSFWDALALSVFTALIGITSRGSVSYVNITNP
jgi:hypothetical protein